MSSSLLPAAVEQDRTTAIAPVSLERVNKCKVRSGNPHPTPNGRPPMFTSDSNKSEWCQSKTFILSNGVSTYDTDVCAVSRHDSVRLGNCLADIASERRAFHSLEPHVSLL